MIFKNAFTFGRWCHYAFTVTVSWCNVITQEWWFRVYFIHAEELFALDQIQLDAYCTVIKRLFSSLCSDLNFLFCICCLFGCFSLVLSFLCITALNHSRQGGGGADVIIHRQSVSFYHNSSVWLDMRDRPIGLVGRVFANGPGNQGSGPGQVIQKTQKMILDASLLNTQHYKVLIKLPLNNLGKVVAPFLLYTSA